MADRVTSREKNYSQWYVDVIIGSKLADYAPVKGCMVIRPRGYALWESMQRVLDAMFKQTGVENAYFPMLIPESFFTREKEHVEGFSPELAMVTHAGGEKLEEPYALRPTSETMIWHMFKHWIQSKHDLPLLINQWANVIRWEKRTRLFLRTTEFLWQEGHTAHATAEEAEERTVQMLNVYKTFAEEYMAMPVITGQKSESEKFAGAVRTYSIEAMMQDNRALQAGTSHNLGRNFGKAFDVTFQDEKGLLQDVYATSWGVSTRLIGALVMTHGDDKGLVIPPKLAAIEAVIIPILRNDTKESVLIAVNRLAATMTEFGLRVKLDVDDRKSPGWKFAEWELAGVPLRVELGARDLEAGTVTMARRDTGEKITVPIAGVCETARRLLVSIQENLFETALRRRQENTRQITSYEEFKTLYNEGPGGFAESAWCGGAPCEKKVKEDTKATIRNLPFSLNREPIEGTCLVCGEKATHMALWAKNY